MFQFTSPEELERRFVHQAYREIAPGFKHTRYKAWPCVENFIRSQQSGSIVVDVGCGTGKYLSVTTNSFIMGSDSCSRFVEIARERQREVAVCNNLRLPYRDSCFDAVISVGVIHHLASSKRRLRALQELARILRPGGKMLVCVWALEQKQRKFDGQDVLVPYRHHKNRVRRRAYQDNYGHQYPKETSKLVEDQSSLRKAKSCDKLFDSCQSSSKPTPNLKGTADDNLLSTSSELRVLRELVNALKSRKEQLICNLNVQVLKLQPDRDTGTINSLLSSLFKRLFDNNQNSTCMENQKKDLSNDKDETGSGKGIPNIPNLLSALVKKLFQDKEEINDTIQSECSTSHFTVSRENELEESTCDQVSCSAKGKLHDCFLSNRKQPTCSLSTARTEKSINRLSRSGSCDSECSDTDVDLTKPFQCNTASSPYMDNPSKDNMERRQNGLDLSSNKMTLHFLARLVESISSSSDTDSDGSISPDLFNSDSGISDSEQLVNVDSPCEKRSSLTSCKNAPCSCPSTDTTNMEKTTALQRFYHVFRERELTELITAGIPTVTVTREYYEHGNWVVVVEKL